MRGRQLLDRDRLRFDCEIVESHNSVDRRATERLGLSTSDPYGMLETFG